MWIVNRISFDAGLKKHWNYTYVILTFELQWWY